MSQKAKDPPLGIQVPLTDSPPPIPKISKISRQKIYHFKIFQPPSLISGGIHTLGTICTI